MLRTNFRVVVGVDERSKNVLDDHMLARIFKCAPARLEVLAPFGLAEPQPEADEEGGIDCQGVLDAVAKLPRTITGKPITPKAMQIYRETFAMRHAFGIPNTERSNIDTSSAKLPKIVAESVERYFPHSVEETLARAAQKPVQTKRQRIEQTLAAFPRRVPTLALRVSLLHKPLWDASDEVARHNWKKIVLPQLKSTLDELQRDLIRLEVPSNLSQEVKDLLHFSRLEVRFDECVLSFANEEDNRLVDVVGALEQYYELINEQAFGQREVYRVDVPFVDYDALEALLREEQQAFEQACAEQRVALEAAQDGQADSSAEDACDDREGFGAQRACAQDFGAQEPCEGVQGETPQPDEGACLPDVSDEGPACADASAGASADACADQLDEQQPNAAQALEASAAEAPGEEGQDPETQPASHYQGAAALRFAEETVSSARLRRIEVFSARAQRAEERQARRAAALEAGQTYLDSLAERVWGVIFADGSLEHFDSEKRQFCPMPDANSTEDLAQDSCEAPALQSAASTEGQKTCASARDDAFAQADGSAPDADAEEGLTTDAPSCAQGDAVRETVA